MARLPAAMSLPVSLVLLLLCLCQLAVAKHCRVDETIDWEDPNNLYTCADDKRCCTEDAKPTCCGDMDEDEEIMRQVKLWGGVIGVIVLFGLLMWYARWDGQCCDEDTRCCGCCRRQQPPSSGSGQRRAQNMGPPPTLARGKADSHRDLLIHEDETR